MKLARLVRLASANAARVQPEDVALGHSHGRFVARRAGFPVARALSSSFLHALEAAGVALLFDPQYLGPLVRARLLLAIASGVLWAGTESVRRDVRQFLYAGDTRAARARLDRSMRLALFTACILPVLGAVWVSIAPHQEGYFTVVDAYILAAIIRIGMSVPVRVLQAGAHAVRRVYRPAWTFFLPDVLDGLAVFALWRALGPWSVPVGVLWVGGLKAVISGVYSRRSLRQLGLRGAVKPNRIHAHDVAQSTRSDSLFWCVAGAAQTAPAWVVLGLWDELGATEAGAALAWVLYAARPIAGLFPRLGGLFYIDFVKTRRIGALAEARLLRFVRGVMWAGGVLLGLGAASLALGEPWLALGLLGFFLLHGPFALEALRVVGFAGPSMSLVAAALSALPAIALMGGADVLLVLAVASAAFAVGVLVLPSLVPAPESELRPREGPVALLLLMADAKHASGVVVSGPKPRPVIDALAPTHRVARAGSHHLVIEGAEPDEGWAVATAGLVDRISPWTGTDGLVLALEASGAKQHAVWLRASRALHDRSLRALADELHRTSPRTFFFAEDFSIGTRPQNVRGADVFRAFRRAANGASVGRELDIAVLYVDGRAALAALSPRDIDHRLRRQLRERLWQESIRAAS